MLTDSTRGATLQRAGQESRLESRMWDRWAEPCRPWEMEMSHCSFPWMGGDGTPVAGAGGRGPSLSLNSLTPALWVWVPAHPQPTGEPWASYLTSPAFASSLTMGMKTASTSQRGFEDELTHMCKILRAPPEQGVLYLWSFLGGQVFHLPPGVEPKPSPLPQLCSTCFSSE